MEMVKLIFGMDDERNPYALLAVVTDRIWGVAFFYDQISLQEYVSCISQYVDSRIARIYSQRIADSDLPRCSFLEPVLIPYYAGRALSMSLEVYLQANAQAFKPWSIWPVISDIPVYRYIALHADNSTWKLRKPEHINAFNALLAVPHSSGEVSLHIAYTREQFRRAVFGCESLDDCEKDDIFAIINTSVMPETSPLEAQLIQGYAARYIFKVMRYDAHITDFVKQYSNCDWQNSFDAYARSVN